MIPTDKDNIYSTVLVGYFNIANILVTQPQLPTLVNLFFYGEGGPNNDLKADLKEMTVMVLSQDHSIWNLV